MTVGSHARKTCAALLLESPDQLRKTFIITRYLSCAAVPGNVLVFYSISAAARRPISPVMNSTPPKAAASLVEAKVAKRG